MLAPKITPDGTARWCSWRRRTTRELVAPTLAQILRVRDIATNRRETLTAYLRPLCLLLSSWTNFEHLLAAAPLVGDLLAGARTLTILTTSREALRLREEQEFPVLPLELPSADRDAPAAALLQCASVELFGQRAAQLVPDFKVTPASARVVADICLRLMDCLWPSNWPPPAPKCCRHRCCSSGSSIACRC